jgi:hypothetical protein
LVFRVAAGCARRQPLPTEALGKGHRVFRLGETEHHEAAVITAQRVRERRRRQDAGCANITSLFVRPLRRVIALSRSAGWQAPWIPPRLLHRRGLVRRLDLADPNSLAFHLIGFSFSDLFAIPAASAASYARSMAIAPADDHREMRRASHEVGWKLG